MADLLRKKTVVQLKVELVQRGASTRGKKEDLIQRIISFDANNNFQNQPIIIPDACPMPDWPNQGFKTLTPSHQGLVPKVSKEQIEMYILYRQVLDKQLNQDIAAMLRGRKMAEQVQAISIAISDSLCFVSSIVSAEMKQVSYCNKIILNMNGDILNTQCECPVGAGVHCSCKHIVAILLSLSTFSSGGDLSITKSCTEELQSFQKPRQLHTRSPKRASDLRGKYTYLYIQLSINLSFHRKHIYNLFHITLVLFYTPKRML